MLYWLYQNFESYSAANVLRYQSFRSGIAALISLLFVVFAGQPYIRFIRQKQYGQAVREDGPQSHHKKRGTPTMGGVLIIVGLTLGTLVGANLSNPYVWGCLGVTWLFGLVGWLDDYFKVIRKNPAGLASRWKFRLLGFGSLLAALWLYHSPELIGGLDSVENQGKLFFPFFKHLVIDLGPWYIALIVFVLIGTSNAVNLTDGLDGLAIGPCVVCAASFYFLCYLGGNAKFAEYLQIPHVPGLGELSIFCAALLAAGVGFLWFNTFPAEIFMGDVGALALGGALGAMAVASKNEFLLVILGGIFVIETLSVIIQVVSFKTRGKRIFKMAPLHHHFELVGWAEPKVIVRFWIVSFVFAVIALATLKLR